MSISGHKTESIFERYNIIDTTDLKRALCSGKRAQQTSRREVTTIHQAKEHEGLNTTIERNDRGEFVVWRGGWILRTFPTLAAALDLQEACRRPEAWLDTTAARDLNLFPDRNN